MKAEEYILNNSFVVYYPAAKCTRVVIDYKALQALEMARKEEREKAINAFKETNNYLLEEINKGNHLTSENTLSKFKELLNMEE